MIICNCPRCHEGFRVPSGEIPHDAYAYCPWCRESFPIDEILGLLPPKLEIMAADGQPLVIGEGAGAGLQLLTPSRHPSPDASIGTIVDGAAGDDFEYRSFQDQDAFATFTNETIQDDTRAPATGGRTAFVSEHSDEVWDEPNPMERMNVAAHGHGRPKRKGAGIGTFIGIVFGGLASVPIAGFLLMMFGRTPDWGFWPFDGGPESSSTRAAAPLPSAYGSTQPSAPRGEPLRFNTEPTSSAMVDPSESAAREIVSATLPPSVDPLEAESDRDPVVANDPIGSPDQEQSDSINDQPISNSQHETSQTSPDPAASAESSELATKAVQMIDLISRNQSSEAERDRRLGVTYLTIAKAASLVDEPSASLQTLATVIAGSPLRADIERAGWKWLDTEKRNSDGIALIGRAVVAENQTFLTNDSGSMVSLVTNEGIADAQEVLILGQLMDQGSALRVLVAEPIP